MYERERERGRYTGSQRVTDTNWNDILEVHCYVVDNNALTKAETSYSQLLLIEFATYMLIKINLMLPIGMVVKTCLVDMPNSLGNLILCLQSGGNMRVSLCFCVRRETLQVVCLHSVVPL